jgi:Flp pilus assembly protein TadG
MWFPNARRTSRSGPSASTAAEPVQSRRGGSIRSSRPARRGAEAIEMGFILPLFVMLVIGIIEFGRGFEVAQILTQAAREGGRLGMLYNVIDQSDKDAGMDTSNEKVITDVKNFLAAAGIKTNVTVDIVKWAEPDADTPWKANTSTPADLDDYGDISEEYFTVLVQVPFDDVAYFTPVFMKDTTLSGQITFRHE